MTKSKVSSKTTLSASTKGRSQVKTGSRTALTAAPRSEFKLTRKSYWSKKRPHISNSQVSDFLKSKDYFYRKHIARTLEPKTSVPMKIGKMVDALITGETLPYGLKEAKGQDPDTYVTEDQLKTATDIAAAIMKEPFFKEYAEVKAEFQKPVEAEIEGTKVCGLLDIYSTGSGKVFIDDVKTAAQYATKNAGQWFFHTLDFGYLRQLAAYRLMVHRGSGVPKESIVCRHIVASKVEDGFIRVRLFVISPKLLDRAEKEFVEAVKEIANLRREIRQDWIDVPLDWENAEVLDAPGGLKQEKTDDFETEFAN